MRRTLFLICSLVALVNAQAVGSTSSEPELSTRPTSPDHTASTDIPESPLLALHELTSHDRHNIYRFLSAYITDSPTFQEFAQEQILTIGLPKAQNAREQRLFQLNFQHMWDKLSKESKSKLVHQHAIAQINLIRLNPYLLDLSDERLKREEDDRVQLLQEHFPSDQSLREQILRTRPYTLAVATCKHLRDYVTTLTLGQVRPPTSPSALLADSEPFTVVEQPTFPPVPPLPLRADIRPLPLPFSPASPGPKRSLSPGESLSSDEGFRSTRPRMASPLLYEEVS